MKKICSLLLALLFACALFGCGDKNPGGDEDGGKTEEPVLTYDSYTLDAYLAPIWKGKIVYNETLLFVGKEDRAPLLYAPSEILSVRSYDLATEYRAGIDYTVEDGCIVLTENTSMPYFEELEYYPVNPEPGTYFECGKPGKPFILFGEGDTFCSKQVAVTYRTRERWREEVPAVQSQYFPKTLAKLRAKQDIKVVFYGDSITTGANSSAFVDVAPYAESWPDMVASWLEKNYGGKVEAVNTAVGGMDTQWGLNNVSARVTAHQPDLVVIGFGMNDISLTEAAHGALMRQLVDRVRSENPDAEILLVSSMLPNQEVPWVYQNQPYFEERLEAIGAELGIGVAKVTSMHQSILEHTRYRDMTGNNVNHPNDFLARVYAQTILQTIAGEDFSK